MTDQLSQTSTPTTSTPATRAFFAWHPAYQGREVESVRRDIADELRRDQRAYELALQAAEQNESASLQSILTLDGRWSPFDLGWVEADPVQLTDYVVAVEVERDRLQRMASPKQLWAQVPPPHIAHAGPAVREEFSAESAGFPISKRWQVIVSALVVLGLIALLVAQLF
ncbi:MAG: hypothetical protein QM753_15450 [Thermomicrobiales bacterium]